MMNYEEALRVIHEKFWQGSKPGLERTRILLNKMGNPQDHLRFIHVAGTNGKGSFCAMLSSILTKAGLKVGTYTSPYVFRFNERMKICGQDIPDQTLAQLVESIYPLAEEMEEKPTEFEWITAIAMAYFYQEKCDVVVLECGMGGRLDSTNVIQDPSLSVITGIALDHTAILGDSLEKIAREKAGIIKKGRPVLDCTDKGPARDVIARQAKKMNAPLIRPRRSGLVLHRQDLGGTEFSWETWDHLFLPLLGTYQTENAQNVLCAVDILNQEGFSVSREAVREGLKDVRWPARFEAILSSPLVLFDGGHNPQGVERAVESVKRYFQDEKVLVVTGVMADKDYPQMVRKISQIAEKAYCTAPQNPRSLPGEAYALAFRECGVKAEAYASPKSALEEAIRDAKDENKAILCLGSLYLYREIREALYEMKKTVS